MGGNKMDVSVIVPVYNAADFWKKLFCRYSIKQNQAMK